MTSDLPDMSGDHNCADLDPELFFPAGDDAERARTRLCIGCPYLGPCRDYALAHDVQGVWGGTTYQQRREARRRRSIRARPVRVLTRNPDADAARKSRARRGVA